MNMRFVLLFAAALPGFAAEFIYLANRDGTVSALDTATMTEVAGSPFAGVPSIGMGSAVSIVVSPDQTRAYFAGWQRSDYVAVFDIEEDGALTHIAGSPFLIAGAAPFDVAISADNASVYVTCPGANQIRLYDADFNFIASTAVLSGSPHPMAISPIDGSLFVAYTDTSQIEKFDSALNSVAGPVDSSTIPTMGTPYGIEVNPAGTFVYATNAGLTEIDVFNASDLMHRGSGTTDLSAPIGMAFSPDGSIIYVANTGTSNIAVLDATSMNMMMMFDFPQVHAPLSSLGNNCYITALSPDGTRLYATNGGAAPAPLAVYNAATYALIPNTYMGADSQYGIAFASPGAAFPENLSGVQVKNDFGLFYEYFNRLSWTTPLNFPVAGYYVYRNGERIATLGPGILGYDDHDRPPGTTATYTVTAFDSGGFESDPATIAVP